VTFGGRLDEALSSRGSLCVGIDPHAALLRDWGLPDDASGLERFALTCVSAIESDVGFGLSFLYAERNRSLSSTHPE